MAVDLFGNNTSNDYINPILAQCPGVADVGSATFEFLPNQQVGVISGSDILMSMGLGDISQSVTGWIQQTKTLQPGEVVFVQGLTKGISQRYQYFPLDGSVAYTGSNDVYYLSVDISINYYKNFRYYQQSIHVEGDYANGITIENAINIEFDARGITVTAAYDASGLSFTGDLAGYSYNITTINASLFEISSDIGETLTEDSSAAIPAFKYPNTGMLGYVLKVTYPSTAEDYEKYVEINHVPDYLEYFTTEDVSVYLTASQFENLSFLEVMPPNPLITIPVYTASETWETRTYYTRHYDAVDVGMSGGSCTVDSVMSAADYLDWVQTNNKWEKVGVLRMWLSAEDPDNSNTENLITGFYIFNPQSFAVQVSYMTIL